MTSLFSYETDHYGEQTGAFDKGADDNGGHPVVTGLLGLAGTGLKRRTTDLTDTESGGESSHSGTDSLSENSERNPGLKQKH